MRLGFFQFDCKRENREKTLEKIWNRLQGESFDLLVLPELFSTGYFFSGPQEALKESEEIPGGPTTRFLADLAREFAAYIIGGIAEKGEARAYSSAVVAGPEGYIGHHRKINLTGWEQKIFTAGRGINIFQLGQVRVGVALCYDLWFPELTRVFLEQKVQLICHPANFGGPMSPVISRARAIENVMAVITANRTGTEKGPEGEETFRGESMVIDQEGAIKIQAGKAEELQIIDLEIDSRPEKPEQLGADLFQQIARYSPQRLEIREWQAKSL